MAMGSIRTGVGASLVIAPAWAGRIWVGSDADGPGTKVFARALGARDVALGAGILAASVGGDEQHVTRLVQLGAVADVADVLATLVAWRNLEGARRWSMPLIALGVAAAGVTVVRMASQAQHSSAPAAPSDIDESGVIDQQAAVLAQMDEALGSRA
jgi:hypothetical protein